VQSLGILLRPRSPVEDNQCMSPSCHPSEETRTLQLLPRLSDRDKLD